MSQPLFGKDRICAVVAASTSREMLAQLRRALKQTRTIELRLDWLRSDKERAELCDRLAKCKFEANLIATLRSRRAGGKMDIRSAPSVESQILELNIAFLSGCNWVDLEVESWGSARFDAVKNYLFGGLAFIVESRASESAPKKIVSEHEFSGTPLAIAGFMPFMNSFGADAVKMAFQCNSYAEGLRLLGMCKKQRNVIAVPMGEIGIPLRVLALREGSALAYAAVGERTAPGQLTLDEMKNLYRADKLNRKTRVYGVIGDPVSHSLSPLMHNLAFHQKRINAVYLPFLVRDLKDFLGAIKPLGIAGFSVTLPHKEKILRHLDDCDPLAAAIGAVNTVVVRGSGKLYGYNTDYVGVLRALERRVRLQGSRVLIFGAGGVARAVAFALAQAGSIVCVSARHMDQAEKLARAVHGEAVSRARIRKEFFDAIVNATPVGMHLKSNESPLAANELNCRLVFDTIYRPLKTKLLRLAEKRGIETVSGIEMFIAQGTAQWEIWTAHRAPVALMRKAVLKALHKEEGNR
jgi:3-dehydroquinate dehydratase/shikimate dehydrogenase